MTRIVKLAKNEPLKVVSNENNIWICQCGLSGKFPFCDGTHKKTKDEEAGLLYLYDENKDRIKISI